MSHTSYTHNLGPSHFPTPNPQARVLPVAVCPHPKDAPRHAMTQAHLKCVNHSICSSYSCIIIIWRYLVTPSIISVPSFLKLRFSPSFIYSSAHCNSSYIRTIAVVGKLRSGGSGDRLPSPRRIFFIFYFYDFRKVHASCGAHPVSCSVNQAGFCRTASGRCCPLIVSRHEAMNEWSYTFPPSIYRLAVDRKGFTFRLAIRSILPQAFNVVYKVCGLTPLCCMEWNWNVMKR